MIKEARKKYIVFSLAQVLRGPWYGVFNSYFVTEWGGLSFFLLSDVFPSVKDHPSLHWRYIQNLVCTETELTIPEGTMHNTHYI